MNTDLQTQLKSYYGEFLTRKMESVLLPPANGLEAAGQIIDRADEAGVPLRLLGGLAFKYMCPSTRERPFYRENKDIDLAGKREDVKKIARVLETLGYKPREIFNKLSMGQRLIYYDIANRRRVDVFLDEFVMCHKLEFKRCLLPGMHTLPITELVMTKLQVVEMTEKEHLDLVAAFRDFDVREGQGGIDAKKIAQACARDWGLYTTFSKSLAAVREKAQKLLGASALPVTERVDRLIRIMEEEPKSLSWRVRARVGTKARWYELPESDNDAVFE
jgi:hypothetical protein